MSVQHPNIINAAQLEWVDTAEANRAASPEDRDRGRQFGARAKMLAAAAHASKLGCTLYELLPGKRSFPFHYHVGNEEAIYILDGEARLRFGDQEFAVRAGDYVAIPPGAELPHQLINTSAAAVHYLCMSTRQYPELVVYPDSKKVGFIHPTGGPGGGVLRQLHPLGTSLGYYEGED
jgi:uncharacterized cupin superfamily protein